MKPPKNFYSNLDRRKQGLPEVPEASAADAGKIIKVGETGAYELADDAGTVLPVPSSSDNGKILYISNDEYRIFPSQPLRGFYVNNYGTLVQARNSSVVYNPSTNIFTVLSSNLQFSVMKALVAEASYIIRWASYIGFVNTVDDNSFSGIVFDDTGAYKATFTSTGVTVTPIGSIKYYEITASGSSVSLDSGVTFAEVYALLQAGVDVKFTSGARVYTVTSFESTNIRAHWISDLDLTSMEVYVINLASDGTGTVASATFSGS